MAQSDSSHPQLDTDTPTTHVYIRVRPTTDAIHPQQVTQALTKLHALPTTDDGGLLRSPTPPTIEMLLVTPANSQRVDYLFGIQGSTLDALDRVLAVWFPNSYERTCTSAPIQTALTQPSDDTQTTTQLTDRSVAGLELHADECHPGDWRTRLTPFADFHEPEATDPATWPLTSVLTALAQTDTPVVVQTLLQPLPDWSAERDERIYELRTNKG